MTRLSTIIRPLAASLLLAVSVSCSDRDSAPRLSDSELLAEFAEPSNEWRGKPFWSWNGKLEKDELIRQVGVLKDMGFGGYFMHSRVGLATEYLGEEWFDLINAVADAGTELGMINYLYDEDRWPSGTAGGYVTMKPEYRLHKMEMKTFPKSPEMVLADTLAAVFTCHLDGTSYTDLQRVHSVEEALATEGETVLAFFVKESERSNFYNGYTMVDEMNREATDYFISLTHEAYSRNCGDRMGNTITGIFTDEPHRGQLFNGEKSISWTASMVDEYAARFGGDILEDLPRIFLHPDGNIYDKAKWNYVELAQELFLENFVEPQAKWCRKNGIAYTGHFLHEDNLTSQVVCQGSLMRDYEHQDIPGIDNLTQYSRAYWAAKQVSSVAHQTGKKMILSELYGCSGWQMSFEDYKDAGDWQALYGINVRCPHLSWYTMKGEAKRDYPASINFQSGWYKDYKFVEDYYARLGLLIAQGEPLCDLLVVNPIESVFAQIAVDSFNGLNPRSASMNAVEDAYRELFHWLAGAQIDFDYGDEDILSRLASVGTDSDGNTVLKVGRMAYKAVFVGNMATIRSSTLSLLKEFASKGGKIVLAGAAPTMVDVELSDEAADFFAASASLADWSASSIVASVDALVPRMARIVSASGESVPDIYCTVRKDADRTTYVMMSMNSKDSFNDVRVALPAVGELSLWDCRTGEVFSAGNTSGEPETSLVFDFAPLQEYVYVVTAAPVTSQTAPEALAAEYVKAQDREYEYSLNELNVLPLDMVTYSAEGLVGAKRTDVLLADREIRKHFGLKYRGGDMLQPWFFEKFVGDSKPSFGEVVLDYDFNVDVLPQGELYLCVESASDFEVKVNGTPLDTETDQWWIDPCYDKIALDKSLLRKGRNVVTLKTVFTEDKNLENIYLVGSFGVCLSGSHTAVTALPASLRIGDTVAQGLPFYTGTISYNLGPVEASSVRIDSFEGACVRVRRGEEVNMIAFPPFVQQVPQGEGDLWLDVVLTRRNSFGPFHLAPAHQWAIGPEHFVINNTEDYVVYPSGLLGLPEFAK